LLPELNIEHKSEPITKMKTKINVNIPQTIKQSFGYVEEELIIESRCNSLVKPLSAQINIHNQVSDTKEILGGGGLFN